MEYTIQKGAIALTASATGAELQSITVDGKEVLWDGKKDVWPRRAPLCFPWCGMLADGTGTFDGRQIRGGRHGFVRDEQHKLVKQTDDSLQFELNWAANDTWPWSFVLETTHLICSDSVITICTVLNTSDSPMAIQLGFHPGFMCPFDSEDDADTVESYQVRFEGGTVIPLNEHTFDNDSLRVDRPGRWARLEHVPSGRHLQVSTEGFYCALVWSEPGIPGFVCIEPWQGYPGPEQALDQRPGAIVIQPGEFRDWMLDVYLGKWEVE